MNNIISIVAIFQNLGDIPEEYFIHATMAIVAVALLVFIGKILSQLKAANKRLEIFKSFPGRVGVCDRRGNIYFLQDDDDKSNIRELKNVSDIKNVNRKEIMAAITTVFNTHEPKTFEYEQKADKRATIISPLEESVMGKETVVWFSHENTELFNARKQAESFAKQTRQNLVKLRTTKKLWDTIINSLPIQIFAKDTNDNFKYVFANKEFCNYVGKTEDEIIGKTDFEIFSEKVAENIRSDDILNLENLDEGIERIREIHNLDGTTHRLKTVLKPFRDSTGKLFLIGTIIDITKIGTEFINGKKIENQECQPEVVEQNISEEETQEVKLGQSEEFVEEEI